MEKKCVCVTILAGILLVISTAPGLDAGVIRTMKPIETKVRKIDEVGTVINNFPLPMEKPHKIAWDGKALWVTDDETGKLYRIDPATGNVLSTMAVAAALKLEQMEIAGLTCDGRDLLIADNITLAVYRVNHETQSAKKELNLLELKRAEGVRSIAMKESRVTGLAWDGAHLWAAFAAGYASSVYRIELSSKTVVKHFWSPGPEPQGLTWDSGSLWIVDGRSRGKIYQFNLAGKWTGKMVLSPAGSPTGVAFDGKNLWNVDKERKVIHKIKVEKKGTVRTHIKGEY